MHREPERQRRRAAFIARASFFPGTFGVPGRAGEYERDSKFVYPEHDGVVEHGCLALGHSLVRLDEMVNCCADDLESDYAENEVGEDLPLGLASVVTTSASGEADLRVVVRHLPELNDVPQKTAELPDAFARGEQIPGSNDVDVTFEVTVE